MASGTQFLKRPDGSVLAYDRLVGTPGVIFLHGLMSDRAGTKAMALSDYCRDKGYGFLRFDMFGHGESSGRFEDGTISRWTEDTLSVMDALTQGPQIVIGSSMGAWVMVKTALARAPRIAGLIGIAAAPDFTEDLMWPGLSEAQRAALQTEGVVDVKSDEDPRPYRIGRVLIEDGRGNLMLRGPIALDCPVRLLHGQQDVSVPWQTSLRLAERIAGKNVEVHLIKDGDHRLSRPQDLKRLCATLDDLVAGART